MKEKNILDDLSENNGIQLKLKKEKKKLTIIILILIVINTPLFGFTFHNPNLDRNSFKGALIANLISFNIIGFILGTIVALLPYKGLSYSQKYVRSSLLVILTIQGLIFISLLLIFIMKMLGYYS